MSDGSAGSQRFRKDDSLKAACGLLPSRCGTVRVCGREPPSFRRRELAAFISYIPQKTVYYIISERMKWLLGGEPQAELV